MPRNRLNSSTDLRRRETGVALVIVLWLLALMSFVATIFAVDVRNQSRAFRNEIGVAQARAAADAGVHLGIRELLLPEQRGVAPI